MVHRSATSKKSHGIAFFKAILTGLFVTLLRII